MPEIIGLGKTITTPKRGQSEPSTLKEATVATWLTLIIARAAPQVCRQGIFMVNAISPNLSSDMSFLRFSWDWEWFICDATNKQLGFLTPCLERHQDIQWTVQRTAILITRINQTMNNRYALPLAIIGLMFFIVGFAIGINSSPGSAVAVHPGGVLK